MNIPSVSIPVILPVHLIAPQNHHHTVVRVPALVAGMILSPEIIIKIILAMHPHPVSLFSCQVVHSSIISGWSNVSPKSVRPMYQNPIPVKLPSKIASSDRNSICLNSSFIRLKINQATTMSLKINVIDNLFVLSHPQWSRCC